MYCSRLFVVVFQEINCLNMPMFVGSQSFISLPNFMFVSAVVSEIRELNQNKKVMCQMLCAKPSPPLNVNLMLSNINAA